MTNSQDVEKILDIAKTLDPRAVSAEVSLTTGARLKSTNFDRVGGRSADPGTPGFDKIDRYVRARHRQYRQAIEGALRQLEAARFIQDQLMFRHHDEHGVPTEEARKLAAEDHSPQAVECANCTRVVERTAKDKLLSGRCRACHRHLKEHGTERPRELWEAADGRAGVVA